MDKSLSKILTFIFVLSGALFALVLHLLVKTFSGAFAFIARASESDLFRHGFPIVSGLVLFSLLQFHPRIFQWAEGVAQEIRKVVWPSQKDVTAMTIAVVVMVFISSIIISAFDFISSFFINQFVR